MSPKRRHSNPFLVFQNFYPKRKRTSSSSSTVVNVSPAKLASGFRVKDFKSFTKTNTMNTTSSGEGLTSSSLTHASTAITRSDVIPKSVKGQCCYVTFSSSAERLSPAGYGAGNLIATEGTTYQNFLKGGVGSNYISNPQLYYNPIAYRDMLPDTFIEGSNTYAARFNPIQEKTFLKSLIWNLSIANFGTCDAVVEIYIFESVKDSAVNPEEFVNQLLRNSGGGLPPYENPVAGLGVGGVVGTYVEDAVISNPFGVKGFSREFKTLSRKRFDLSAGSVHEQNYAIKANLFFDQTRLIAKNPAFTTSAATWLAENISMKFPKGTLWMYAKQRGTVVMDKTIARVPTIAATSIGYLLRKELSMHYVDSNSTKPNYASLYAQIPYGAAEADQKFVNVVDTAASFGKV